MLSQQYESKPTVPVARKTALSRTFSGCLFFSVALAPSLAAAAPPTQFGNWSETGGVISATCPAGFACIDGVQDNEILQRTLVAPDGQKYTQLILSDHDTFEGTAQTESFTGIGSAKNDGVSVRQSNSMADAVTTQSSTVELNTGWANTSGTAIQIDQTLNTTYLGVGYEGTFSASIDRDANGNKTGSYVANRQRLTGTTTLPSSTTTATGQDVQTFVTRRASGDRVATAGSASLPASQGGRAGQIGVGVIGNGAGGTVTWQAGQDVGVTWIGQLCQGCPQAQGGFGGGGGGGGVPANSTFSYQTFDNFADANAPIASVSIISTNPFTWVDPPFGAQPSL